MNPTFANSSCITQPTEKARARGLRESFAFFDKQGSGLPEMPNRGRMTPKYVAIYETPAKQIE
jgi:hypothetical protein